MPVDCNQSGLNSLARIVCKSVNKAIDIGKEVSQLQAERAPLIAARPPSDSGWSPKWQQPYNTELHNADQPYRSAGRVYPPPARICRAGLV